MGLKRRVVESIAIVLGASEVGAATTSELPLTEAGKKSIQQSSNVTTPELKYRNTIAGDVKPRDLVAENQDLEYEKVELLLTSSVVLAGDKPTIIKIRGRLPEGVEVSLFKAAVLNALASEGYKETNEQAKSTTVLDLNVAQESFDYLGPVKDIASLNKRLWNSLKIGLKKAALRVGIELKNYGNSKLPWGIRGALDELASSPIYVLAKQISLEEDKMIGETNPIVVAKNYQSKFFVTLSSSLNSNEKPSMVFVFLQIGTSQDGTFWITNLECKNASGIGIFELHTPLPLVTKIEPSREEISKYAKMIVSAGAVSIVKTWDKKNALQPENTQVIQASQRNTPKFEPVFEKKDRNSKKLDNKNQPYTRRKYSKDN